MTVFDNHRYAKVALPKDTHKLAKHIAKEIGAPIHSAIATGLKLLQEKLEIPNPPTGN